MKNQINKQLNRVSQVSLSEKQSVRTTFNLSENSNNAIDWLVEKNNLKPKEVFDLVCSNDNLIQLAVEAAGKNETGSSLKQVRKTFVISKRVLRLLNKLSKEHEVSRDLIVGSLILLFKLLLEKHSEEEKQREKKAHAIISDFLTNADDVEQQLKKLLDNDNPIIERFGLIVVVVMNLVSAITSKLSNGIPIEPDDFSQS